jgi:DNA invertase Pin-like site-specific DNA recombinase
MKIGYARISTDDQNLNLQMDALKRYGCEKIFSDRLSGGINERPGLKEAISFARKGDALVVWRLDRLGRSISHLIETVNSLNDKGIEFASLEEKVDTTTSGGRLTFHIMAALAEFERSLIRERTKAGLAAARARGRVGGRPAKMDSQKIQMAKALLKDSTTRVNDVCKALGVSKATLYRYL